MAIVVDIHEISTHVDTAPVNVRSYFLEKHKAEVNR